MTNYSASSISLFIHSLGLISIGWRVSVNECKVKALDQAVYCLEATEGDGSSAGTWAGEAAA